MTLPPTAGWWTAGEAFFQASLDATADLAAPSLLPGWDRRTLVAHVARNADALGNLLAWARTGVETPMYASVEARDAGIAASAGAPADELRADVRAASRRLDDAARALPAAAWAHEVRTAQGRTVPAAEVLWMRCREVWVHAVDLGGASFDGVPDDVLVALLEDVLGTWSRRGESPDVTFRASSRAWGSGGTVVTGALPELVALVAGRAGADVRSGDGGPLPALPRWL